MQRGQSEALVPMAQVVLSKADLDFAALDAVAVTRGPGSFTGVRIGLAAARAIALARGIPAIGLTSFDVYAGKLRLEDHGLPMLVAIESGRDEVFAQGFDASARPLGEAACLRPEELADSLEGKAWILAGSAADRVAASLAEAGLNVMRSAACGPIDAADVAQLAAQSPLPAADAASPAPLYLRPADVSMPSKALLKSARPSP